MYIYIYYIILYYIILYYVYIYIFRLSSSILTDIAWQSPCDLEIPWGQGAASLPRLQPLVSAAEGWGPPFSLRELMGQNCRKTWEHPLFMHWKKKVSGKCIRMLNLKQRRCLQTNDQMVGQVLHHPLKESVTFALHWLFVVWPCLA